MRAKRSKKYRKIMSSYQMHFSFRQPYQVLCDSTFLRQCHAFSMPVAKFLSNTLHGDARPYVTQCSLAAATNEHRKQVESMKKKDGERTRPDRGRGDGKPTWLPPPTEVPLRYCKHKDNEGNETGVIEEADCLIDLVSGQAKGNEVRKNKNHYVLATAELEESQQQQQNTRKRKRASVEVRETARQIPGVPIVYVKRSVMVLEELSGASERTIRGLEKEKMREGLVGAARNLKRKRTEGEESDDEIDGGNENNGGGPKIRGPRKAKGPNPLSIKKKKIRPAQDDDAVGQDGDTEPKKQRRRKRGKKSGGEQPSRADGAVPEPSTEQTNEGASAADA